MKALALTKELSHEIAYCKWYGCEDLYLERCNRGFIILKRAPSIYNSNKKKLLQRRRNKWIVLSLMESACTPFHERVQYPDETFHEAVYCPFAIGKIL
jgi:hypothetical protein